MINNKLELENVMMKIDECLDNIKSGADPKDEILFTINVLECILDADFTEKQYEDIYEMIYELI